MTPVEIVHDDGSVHIVFGNPTRRIVEGRAGLRTVVNKGDQLVLLHDIVSFLCHSAGGDGYATRELALLGVSDVKAVEGQTVTADIKVDGERTVRATTAYDEGDGFMAMAVLAVTDGDIIAKVLDRTLAKGLEWRLEVGSGHTQET